MGSLELPRGARDGDDLDGPALSLERVPEPAVRRAPGAERGRGVVIEVRRRAVRRLRSGMDAEHDLRDLEFGVVGPRRLDLVSDLVCQRRLHDLIADDPSLRPPSRGTTTGTRASLV